MKGDFSVLNFDPHEHTRGVSPPVKGVLRNVSGVLHQQGRVTTDADMTEGELLELAWNGQAGRDIIGAGICAVPAAEPEGFRVESAVADGEGVRVMLRPGRAWVDGILTRLPGETPDPLAPVERLATYLGPPMATPEPSTDQIGDDTRDAVILEVSEEALHGFQYPERLIEPALGGPDTSERAYVNIRLRLLRLSEGEDCTTIIDKLRDDPASKGRLTASLAPIVEIAGDCPVVGGGGYSGFEHHLYRIEIADTAASAPARFKWSQWNGGLVGRGRFDTGPDPDRVIIDAGRAAIINCGWTDFYLEALQYDDVLGAWVVVYGTTATLNTDHDLVLTSPASFGTLPSTTDPVFFRLWNGIADIQAFTNAASPVELRDGIRLVFDSPAAGRYRPGDYWTFPVRAGEIANPDVLVDDAPPVGVVYHRVPLAEINWTGRRNTTVSGTIEDCRRRFRPLTNQKVCCTFLVGNGVTSFGDFNSLEQAAEHLPAGGGELCLLPGLHRANLTLTNRRNVTIHGCARRTLVLPRTETRFQPILHFAGCTGIRVCDLDLMTFDGTAVLIDRSRDVCIEHTRMVARVHAIRANDAAEVHVAHNRLHLLDTAAGLTTISLEADDSLVERNTLLILPYVHPSDHPDEPDEDPTRDPADPCAKPEVIYRFPHLVWAYAQKVWTFAITLILPVQPYHAMGGIHLRAGCERVRLLENEIVGGAGNGVTLGGDLDPAPVILLREGPNQPGGRSVPVRVDTNGQFLAVVQDEAGAPQPGVDVYLDAGAGMATDRTDAEGMASVKAAPGTYTLGVAPKYQVLRVNETRDQGVLVNAVTIGPRSEIGKADAFLHEITIEANDISMMGLSGIGFALRAGASIEGRVVAQPATNAKASLLTFVDAAILTLAMTPLVRAAHPVRDLVILHNRLRQNLRNPFTDALLADAQQVGRGGVSLGVVESLVVRGNHISDNGVSAADPACGVFVGWGHDVEVTDNAITGNGATTPEFEDKRRAGIRGGVYVRFAGALVTRQSSSSGRRPALRVHDNRVDQPAGRALTAFAFGPVSVANNHLSSEFTGRFGFLDAAFGGVLILNLGGVHRLIARIAGGTVDNTGRFKEAAEASLPGGETLISDNYVRIDAVNRSIMAQGVVALDDLGWAGNTSAVYRGDPFFCNTLLIGDTLRATGGRLREDASRALSMLTFALRGNITSMNQADHCIFVRPPASASHQPKSVDAPNHVFDPSLCRDAGKIGEFAAPALSAHASQLGGTIGADAFSEVEVKGLARHYTADALMEMTATQVAVTRAYQTEHLRLLKRDGDASPKVMALSAMAEAGVATRSLLAAGAEAMAVPVTKVPEAGSSVTGRVVDAKGRGQAGYTVELVTTRGAAAAILGRTDANGAVNSALDAAETARLVKQGALRARVLDAEGKEVASGKEAVVIITDAEAAFTVTLPARVVPRAVAVKGTVIFEKDTGDDPAPVTPVTPVTPAKRARRTRTRKPK